MLQVDITISTQSVVVDQKPASVEVLVADQDADASIVEQSVEALRTTGIVKSVTVTP